MESVKKTNLNETSDKSKEDEFGSFKDEIVPSPLVPSYRFLLLCIGFIGGVSIVLCRSNISIAVVCMVIDDENTTTNTNYSSNNLKSKQFSVTRAIGGWYREPVYHNYQSTEGGLHCVEQSGGQIYAEETGEFDWSRDLQGVIIAANSYGALTMQLGGGTLATKFGAKWVVFIGITLHTVFTFLSPIGAEVSVYLLILLQVLKGASSAVYFPAFYALWGKWAPPAERSKLVSIMLAGNSLGNILSYFTSGYLCEYVGWESLFYVYGIVAIPASIVWPIFVSNSPENHPYISEKERKYIELSIIKDGQLKATAEEETKVPWKDIFTSKAVWACAIADFCFIFGLQGATKMVPLYMEEVLHVDIAENGVYSSMPHVAMFIMTLLGAFIADKLLDRGFSKGFVRKLMQNLGLWMSAPFVFSIGFLDCTQVPIAVFCFCGWLGFSGFCRSGSAINQIEIAPRYAGIIQGITNTIGLIPSAVAPSIITSMTPNGTQEEWRNVFFLNGAIYIVGGLVFILFSSGNVQEWAMPEAQKQLFIDKDEKVDEQKSVYSNQAFVNEEKGNTKL